MQLLQESMVIGALPVSSQACTIAFENLTYSVPVPSKGKQMGEKKGQKKNDVVPVTGLVKEKQKMLDEEHGVTRSSRPSVESPQGSRGKSDRSGPVPRKTILNQMTGVFEPGKLIAIMGASGAGKTSLLHVLSGRSATLSSANFSGAIYLNGSKVKDTGVLADHCGFVFQDDIILPTMTVREAIRMSALLRLPASMSLEEKEHRVEQVIQCLHLCKAASTMVGSATEPGISGGERKRTSLAMELVTHPAVLFLDEPTSGLDTFTAYHVMATLKQLCQQGRTVICTIHQPSSEIFHLFDDVLFLSEGHLLYQGPADQVVEYFANLGYPCPKYTNPADYVFMSVLSEIDMSVSTGASALMAKFEGKQASSMSTDKDDASLLEKQAKHEAIQERLRVLRQAWLQSPDFKRIQHDISFMSGRESLSRSTSSPSLSLSTSGASITEIPSRHGCKATIWTQFEFLLQRASLNAFRNKMIVKMKIFQALFIGILVGLIYLNLPDRALFPQKSDRVGSIFFLCVNMVMSSSMGVLSVFALEKQVFIREFGAGYYSLPAYFFSKVIVELPYLIISPILTISVAYFMIGFQASLAKFAVAALNLVLLTNCGAGIGLFAACLFDSIHMALAILPLVLLPLMIFSGVMVTNASIPVYFDWLKYLSPMKYGFTAMAKNEFMGLTLSNCPSHLPGVACTGEAVLADFGLEADLTIWQNELMILGLYLLMLLLSYFCLYRLTRRRTAVLGTSS